MNLTRVQKLLLIIGFSLKFFSQLISTNNRSSDSPPAYLVTMVTMGHDSLSLGLGQLMRLFPSLTHLLAIIVNLILLKAKVKFILLILYKYTLKAENKYKQADKL